SQITGGLQEVEDDRVLVGSTFCFYKYDYSSGAWLPSPVSFRAIGATALLDEDRRDTTNESRDKLYVKFLDFKKIVFNKIHTFLHVLTGMAHNIVPKLHYHHYNFGYMIANLIEVVRVVLVWLRVRKLYLIWK
ncbi:hypothetical protein ACJX0J_039384, partial [Zea mays]